MKFDGPTLALTPPEASFIQSACSFQAETSPATEIKLEVRTALINWSISVLPPEFVEQHQGNEGARSMFPLMATDLWTPADGEVIKIDVDADKLAVIRQMSSLAVQKAQAEAERLQTEGIADDDLSVSSDEKAALRAHLTQFEMTRAAIGQSILAAIEQQA